MKTSSLSGKVAVIIGGTGGIGFAAGRALADIGASVVLTGRDMDRTASAVEGVACGQPSGGTRRKSVTAPRCASLPRMCITTTAAQIFW